MDKLNKIINKRYILSLFFIIIMIITACSSNAIIYDESEDFFEENIIIEEDIENNDDSINIQDEEDESITMDDDLIDVDSHKDDEDKNEPKGSTSVNISVVGDIMVHQHQLKAAKQSDGSYNFHDMFTDIKPYIESADIAIGNLETTISNDEIGYFAYPRFRTPEALIPALSNAGFDVLTTANNHSLDGVEFGVINTLDILDKYDILHTGTARSYEEQDEILIIEKNDIKIAILAYTYGTNGMESAINSYNLPYMVNYLNNKDKISKDIEEAKAQGVEFIIMCAHWGDEYVRTPNDNQKNTAEDFFAMGIDVIFGSHPHVLQGTTRKEITDIDNNEKEVFVIYSLGNIISNQRDRYRDSGVILNLEIIKDYEDNTVKLGETDYIPTWVYRFTENDRLYYRILPVKDFTNEELPSDVKQRLDEVWKETTEHLEEEYFKAR